ncbi:hypothetical protein PLESTF_001763400 [Pleodorina starrii]|nr:hypothetical protein PLESTF_001763400 [Pleodorina starrii]
MLASPGQAASFVACVSMGVVGNLPFGLAPGMGINAYVHVTRRWGSNVMLRAGFLLLLLSQLPRLSRAQSANQPSFPTPPSTPSPWRPLIPSPRPTQSSEGIGLISFESATLVTLGGCRVEDRAPLYGVIVGVCSYLLLYLLLLGYDLLTAIL